MGARVRGWLEFAFGPPCGGCGRWRRFGHGGECRYRGMCEPGGHDWTGRLISTPDVYDYESWCDRCGAGSDDREDG